MTKTEIIAELRRSAAEDESPYWQVDDVAWLEAKRWAGPNALMDLNSSGRRAMFLLAACALEEA